MNASKILAVIAGVIAGAVFVPGAIAPVSGARPDAQRLAQAELTEPTEDSCVLLQEVATGKTEVRRRIEN